jgi:carboxyl-terminal processing protease
LKKILLFIFFSAQCIAQSEKSACITLSKINAAIKEFHFKPKPINDSLSAYVFNNFIRDLDIGNDLFVESEINYLKKHKFRIDDYILNKNCSFFQDFYLTYQKAATRHNKLISNIVNEDFPLSSSDILQFYTKSKPHQKTENDLKNIFKKRILFDILKDISETSKNKDSIIKEFTNISKISKQKVFDDYSCQANRFNITFEDFTTQFFNIYCNYFDPHSNYFTTKEKSDFLSSLSADNYSYGLVFSVNDDKKITISELTPGGPAYFSEKIEIGDEIIKIRAKEEVLINCNNYSKIEKILGSNDIKSVYFTFRKKNGTLFTVNLTKQIMKDYQNSIYSFILERDSQKTAYIKIPSFYSTQENGKSNMSDDFKKELYKIKEDSISGLIIDLENNGGGSMQEAIKLCGFFINSLYIGQELGKNKQRSIIGNEKYKSIYSGPIIILINGFSASASEFFANTMQDYNLAVIVGSKSFGKATYQQILPLAETDQEFVKLTMGKFYRITGKSNQNDGLIPDIEIPNLFENQMPGENDYKTAFKNDKIEGIVDTSNFPKNEKQKQVIIKYKTEIKSNNKYQTILSTRNKFNVFYKNPLPPIALNFNSVFETLKIYNSKWKEIENFSKTEYPFTISNTNYDKILLDSNSNLKAINKKQLNNLKKSFTVYESIKIMGDLK